MSVAQQKQIDLLKDEVRKLRKLVLSRDEKLLKKVMREALFIFLKENVEINVEQGKTVEEQIKEFLIDG